ncbi:F510_1955 family glycosylhydrolase [Streptomyces sp. YIM 98790]|uniref:F510_1955 family glycosylhydrolase n=1 Tax=Streptomyces sp. YIM 98790 TaxID=2689077 RepID=UPI00140B65B7|nr:sialidase family protein [Streptomyces sp. YIM 98790]
MFLHTRIRRVLTAATAALVLALTACGSDDSGDGEETAAPQDVDLAHIHGLGINPADGLLYVATHHGVITVRDDGSAELVSEDRADYMGFTVAGPDHFYGSGHPEPGSDEPADRGLLESTDGGRTWTALSLAGEADFHALEYAHDTLYGHTHGRIMTSPDGRTWDTGAEIAAVDLAVSPDDPALVLATTQRGIATSTDGGATFDDGGDTVAAFLSWAPDGTLYGLDPDSTVLRSEDGGATWTRAGQVPGGGPQALTALADGRLLAATGGGVYESTDAGESFTERIATTE